MTSPISDQVLLETIEQLGFTREEALIYFTLVKHGKNGAIVKQLVQETSLGRTTIYAIINRLIEKNAVTIGGPSNTAKKATLFIASPPTRFFSGIIEQKKRALHEVEERNLLYHDHFQRLYQQGTEFSYETLDPFIQPYLKTLILEEGWTVISQIVEKGMPTFGCDVFAYELRLPETISGEVEYQNKAYFIVYSFDYDIEANETSRKFFIELARRKTRENIKVSGPFADVKLEDGEITFFGRTWPAFLASGKVGQKYVDIGQIPIFPIKDKLIFISAGISKSLEVLAQVVYEVLLLPTMSP